MTDTKPAEEQPKPRTTRARAAKEDGKLLTALAAFQSELPRVTKGSVNTRFGSRYADLADVSTAVIPLLAKHGLTWVAKPTLRTAEDGATTLILEYALTHTSGEEITGIYPLSEGTPQDMGGQITYARRYCLCAVTGVAPEGDDDDAHSITHNAVQVQVDWEEILMRARQITDPEELRQLWRDEHLARAPKRVRAEYTAHVTSIKTDTPQAAPPEEAEQP